MAPAQLNASNPHRNTVRNLRKKVNDIADLKSKDPESLDDGQQKKIKMEKKTKQELEEAEKKYDIWEAEQPTSAPTPAPTPAPAAAPAPAAGKKAKAEPAAEKPAEEKKKAKEDKKAAPAAAKSAPAPEPEPAADVASLIDPKEEKTIRNRIKNLKTKLDQIAELKKKDPSELADEQKTKIKGEKKIRDEHTQLVGKLQAFGLKP